MDEATVKAYLQKSLEEWKQDISIVLAEIDKNYEEVALELTVYSYKHGITKQVIQSTVNEEIIEVIRDRYHKPFEEKYNQLKEQIRDLEEKRRVFQMFIHKIDEVTRKTGSNQSLDYSSSMVIPEKVTT